jgi:cell division protein FtsQ
MGNSKRLKRLKDVLLILILLFILVCMVLIGTEIFQIKIITVSGNEKILYNNIVNISGIEQGDNIFKLDKELVKKRIENAQPYLEVISIDRKYPDEVVIHVRERQAAAAIPYLSSYIIIDREGIVLDILRELDAGQYPEAEGLHVKSFMKGKIIVLADSYQLKALCRVIQGIYDWDVQNHISKILMANPDDIILISPQGIEIRLGQAVSVDQKLKWLTKTEVLSIIHGNENGQLDISAEGQAVFHPASD